MSRSCLAANADQERNEPMQVTLARSSVSSLMAMRFASASILFALDSSDAALAISFL